MKKQLLIGSVLLAAISGLSQTAGKKPQPSGLINTAIIATSKYIAAEGTPVATTNVTVQNPNVSGTKVNATSSVINNWNNFTASMNIYGVSIGYTKPLQWNDELDAVSFIHRKSPSYVSSPAAASNAENGTMVAMVSTNWGATWDSTCIWVNDNFWARFPGGAIYNPASNTNISNAYIVGSGATTANNVTGFVGNWYASKPLSSYDNTASAVPNAQQLVPVAGPFQPNLGRHDFAVYAFTATDDGKMRVLAGISDPALSPVSDTSIMLVTGTFTNGVFEWEGKVFNPPTTLSSSGAHNFGPRPLMAWNEAGTVGYVVIMGSRLGATGSNVGFQPMVYKTTNSGATWSLESGINFNGPNNPFADVKRSLSTVSTDNTLEIPNFFFGEGMDCTVDANNKLHIFTTVLGHTSTDMDSLNFVNQFTTEKYLWPHKAGFRPYLYDFIYDGTNTFPSWSKIVVDSMPTEGPGALTTSGGYQQNPWDPDPSQANRKIALDARLQMSRTPNGQHLVYTWAETDTTFTTAYEKWNILPNVKARVLDVSTGVINPLEIDITGPSIGDISAHSMFHCVSPKCKLVSNSNSGDVKGTVIKLPITVSNSSPYRQLLPNSHWFSAATLDFTVSTVGITENNLNSVNNLVIYPNPAKNNATVRMNLDKSAKIQIDVLNTVGQMIKSNTLQGQTGLNAMSIDLSGIASGIYMVHVKTGDASSTKKLLIE